MIGLLPCGYLVALHGAVLQAAAVVSRSERLRQVSESLGSPQALPLGWIIIAAGGVLVIVSLVSALKWWRTGRLRPHPLVVFNRIAREVGLPLRDQALLYRIAVREKLPTPLTLMLSGRTLGHHARGYLRRLRPWRRRRARLRLITIRRSLFAPGRLPRHPHPT